MLKEIIRILNGDRLVNYHIYECDSCEKSIEESWPHFSEDENTKHYCGECAFKLNKLNEKEYIKNFLYFIGRKGLRAAINPETGEVEITLLKRFPWEGRNRDHRKSKRYINWRQKVFERDDFTCQKCRGRGGDLEAHHIKSFAKYKSERFKVDNGVTMCKGCHKKIHKEKDHEWIHTD